MDNRLRIRHLRCFLETARLGSLSAAAAALHVSQPAASKTIRELEDILGKPLFDRTKRRLVLTSAGRLFQQHAGEAMTTLARAEKLVKDVPSENTRLSVGALPTSATSLLPRAALMFRERFPKCALRVSTGPNWLLMSQLRDGGLDLVVGRMGSAEVMTGLSFRQLDAEPIIAVVRPDHPILSMDRPLDGLAQHPLIIPPSGAVIAPLVRAFLARQSISHHAASYETVSLAFGRKIVQMSDAIWFISNGVVQDEIDAGSLVAVPLGNALQAGPVGISMRSEGELSDEQIELVAALESAIKTVPGRQVSPTPFRPGSSG